jgi:hypothetical protein
MLASPHGRSPRPNGPLMQPDQPRTLLMLSERGFWRRMRRPMFENERKTFITTLPAAASCQNGRKNGHSRPLTHLHAAGQSATAG